MYFYTVIRCIKQTHTKRGVSYEKEVSEYQFIFQALYYIFFNGNYFWNNLDSGI